MKQLGFYSVRLKGTQFIKVDIKAIKGEVM